ncbi:MAG: UDP-2,3-diacylglucosamine diphosphatase LpxI [Candidatus Omnitrophica bacterium]|nr:UDP-2,3-diacylglucosamine diphosphatase LpxI [Candidatus Omnitrophota bacterium]
MNKIGLIAGNRRFPIVFAQGAKKKGKYIVAIAIKGETSRQLKSHVDKLYWLSLVQFRQMFEVFKSEGVEKVAMAGQISPYRLFSKEVRQNRDLKELISSIQDNKANTIFSEIASRLKEFGLDLIDSTTFVEDLLPKKGTLTRRQPNQAESLDIRFGLELAKEVARLDIGQTVAVKSKAIVAVEALEGTDNLIRRAGRIARGGITVVKVSRPNQDMRFDIPVIGFNTVKTLVKANATCLAIEAGKTLFIDREESVKLADKKGITIIAA